MTKAAQFIAEALAGQQEIEPITRGYRRVQPEGTTELIFRSAAGGSSDFPLTSIATVETRFAPETLPDFSEGWMARFNRRAVFGSFFRDAEGIGCRLTYSLYKHESAARWVADYLLDALGQQLAYGFGVARAELSEEDYHAARAAYFSDRDWVEPLASAAFEDIAQMFRPQVPSSMPLPAGIVLQVPIANRTALEASPDTARVTVRTDILHPVAGVGYYATIALPRSPAPELLMMWCTQLNAFEHAQEDFVPRLGAWGMRNLDAEIVYGMFWPTDRADANAVRNIANWMMRRALWIGNRLWTPGVGLRFREDATS